MNRPANEVPMDPWSRLCVPTARVAADVVDGEVVVINLDTGSYYSTEGTGCDTWVLLATGRTRAEVVEALGDRYEADDGVIGAYVDAFAAKVLADGLMAPLAPDEGPIDTGDLARLAPITTRVPFVPADFVGYDDMKGLLLLDPVHDVDERGWPHAAAGG